MNRFILFVIIFFKILLLMFFSIEVLAILGGMIFNLMNPEIKGVSKTDFSQLFVLALITGSLLLFFIYLQKRNRKA